MSEKEDRVKDNRREQNQLQQGDRQAQAQPQQQDRPSDGDSSLNRRQLLLIGDGGLGLGSLFAVWQLGSNSGGGIGSPEGVIREYFNISASVADGGAIDDAMDRLREIYHENSPEDLETERPELIEEKQRYEEVRAEGGSVDLSLSSVAVAEQSPAVGVDGVEEFALVDWNPVATVSLDGQLTTKAEGNSNVVAQNTGGEWKYWSEDDELPVYQGGE